MSECDTARNLITPPFPARQAHNHKTAPHLTRRNQSLTLVCIHRGGGGDGRDCEVEYSLFSLCKARQRPASPSLLDSTLSLISILFSSKGQAKTTYSREKKESKGTMGAPEVAPSKANIGVFTNPKHDLWIADATPSVEDASAGKGLKPGEVTIEVRSTGICGYVDFFFFPSFTLSPGAF